MKLTKEQILRVKNMTLEEMIEDEEAMEVYSQVMEDMKTSPIIVPYCRETERQNKWTY